MAYNQQQRQQQPQNTAVTLVEEVQPGKYPGLKELQYYQQQGYNLLMPSESIVRDVSPIHRMTFDVIRISTNDADGEVYPLPFGKLGLSKVALLKMASAMGIQFQTQRLDDNRDRDYVWYRATAAMRKPDGTVLYYPAEKEIDLKLIEEKLRLDGKKNDMAIRKEMIQIREHRLALCETKAILRALRGIAAIPTAMTKEKLDKPFVVPRVSYLVDYSDPEVRRQVAAQAQQATQSLFGAAPQPIQQPQVMMIQAPQMQQAPRYLGTGGGLDDDEPAVGYAQLPEPAPQAEHDHIGDTTHMIETQQAPQVVTPEPAPQANPAPQEPAQVVTPKGKGKPKAEPQQTTLIPVCDTCGNQLNEVEADGINKGFPARCNVCVDKELADEGGAM